MSEPAEPANEPAEPYRINRTDLFSIDSRAGERVAHLMIQRRHGVIWFWSLWVHSKHQGKRLATRLITEALTQYQNDTVYLQVWAFDGQSMSDDALCQFYRTFGFYPVPDAPSLMVRTPHAFEGVL